MGAGFARCYLETRSYDHFTEDISDLTSPAYDCGIEGTKEKRNATPTGSSSIPSILTREWQLGWPWAFVALFNSLVKYLNTFGHQQSTLVQPIRPFLHLCLIHTKMTSRVKVVALINRYCHSLPATNKYNGQDAYGIRLPDHCFCFRLPSL